MGVGVGLMEMFKMGVLVVVLSCDTNLLSYCDDTIAIILYFVFHHSEAV